MKEKGWEEGARKDTRKNSEFVGAPDLGSAEGGHPDLSKFVPISPFSSDLFRFVLLVFGNTPICSDLFRFLPICSDLLSEQIRTNQGNPFLPTPFANPRIWYPYDYLKTLSTLVEEVKVLLFK